MRTGYARKLRACTLVCGDPRRPRQNIVWRVRGSFDEVDAVARALGIVADSGNVEAAPEVGIQWAFAMPLLLRHLADDLRTFYHEAIAAQPGPVAPNHHALTTWIFGHTALGDALQAIARHLTDSTSNKAKFVRGLIIPEGFFEGGSAFPASAEFGVEPICRVGSGADVPSVLSVGFRSA